MWPGFVTGPIPKALGKSVCLGTINLDKLLRRWYDLNKHGEDHAAKELLNVVLYSAVSLAERQVWAWPVEERAAIYI